MLNHELLGQTVGPTRVSWSARDAMLYALGVGAGQDDALTELQFTTGGPGGDNLMVLPTFVLILLQFRGPEVDLGKIDPSARLHAEQALTVHERVPANGTLDVRRTVTGVHDKGKAAIVTIESTATDPATGRVIASSVSNSFIRGAGGFGGNNSVAVPPAVPQRHSDAVFLAPTRRDQALLYRLSGDLNPLHFSPSLATRAGFPGPILHGLCTYGIVSRVLVNKLCDGNPASFRHIFGRFTNPVLPGERLSVHTWAIEPGLAMFQVRNENDAVVIDRGCFEFDERTPS